jgi:hypothetical protein
MQEMFTASKLPIETTAQIWWEPPNRRQIKSKKDVKM